MGRQLIPLRKRFFLGCEGESERSYVKFLYDLAKSKDKAVHLDAQLLREGDPLSRIEFAIKIVKKSEIEHGRYSAKFVILDHDQYGLDPRRTRRAEDISKENEIAIVWQRPDHEGFLCRHFEHLRDRQILNKREATSTLEVAWPNYEKNQTAIQIQKILSIKHVLGAADTLPEFKRLLAAIGFLED